MIITDVRAFGGDILVAACHEENFLQPGCFRHARAQAQAGEVAVTLSDVPPGRFAFQAFHDVNRNEWIDTNLLGMPKEGMGFSNDAPMRFGPPTFTDAAVAIGAGDATVRFRMRYFD